MDIDVRRARRDIHEAIPASATAAAVPGGGGAGHEEGAFRTSGSGGLTASGCSRRRATSHDSATLRKYSSVIGSAMMICAVTMSPGVMTAVTKNTATIAMRH